jgi:predicted phage tail protein
MPFLVPAIIAGVAAVVTVGVEAALAAFASTLILGGVSTKLPPR